MRREDMSRWHRRMEVSSEGGQGPEGASIVVGWKDRVKLGYNVMEGSKCFVSIQMSVVLTEEYNVVVNRGVNWYHRISVAFDGMSLNDCCCNWVQLFNFCQPNAPLFCLVTRILIQCSNIFRQII
jgi:hypothetical protein